MVYDSNDTVIDFILTEYIHEINMCVIKLWTF